MGRINYAGQYIAAGNLRKFPIRILLLSFFFLFAAFGNSDAKGALSLQSDNTTIAERYSSVESFEKYLIEVLTQSAGSTQQLKPSSTSRHLDQTDLFYLTKVWGQLDNSVKKVYLETAMIPDTSKVYASPGGHFEVYYSPNPVASHLLGDSYGYGANGNWRTISASANGVPDFVDEIAWALDSSWSLEIEKFSLTEPIPYTDTKFTSTRYKVLASNSGDYGSTYPIPADKSIYSKGWASFIELSTDWETLGYDTNPEDAIRVTCAHEFFHAIQFGMTWYVSESGNLVIDDFPIAWLEGTATSMEEIAFPEVNDYHQYITRYFLNPEQPLFNDDVSNTFYYANALPSLYLYKHLASTPDIAFVRTIMNNNYQTKCAFHQNLRTTAQSFNTTWTALLHQFHRASFFSGTYGDTSYYLPDAGQFDTLRYSTDAVTNAVALSKSVAPYGMRMFTWQQSALSSDTLLIRLNHVDQNNAEVDIPWAASAIILKPSPDTVIPIKLDNNGDGSLTIGGITASDKIMIIVTNGQPLQSASYEVTFDNCPVTHVTGDSLTITARDSSTTASLFVQVSNAVRCDASMSITEQKELINKAKIAGFTQVSPVFSVTLPDTWITGSVRTLTVTVPKPADTSNTALYAWNENLISWEKLSTSALTVSGDSLMVKAGAITSGLYTILSIGKELTMSMYPNPVSLRNGYIVFDGAIMHSLYIYNAIGILTYKYKPDIESTTTSWDLSNSERKKIVPGFYFVIVKYYEKTGGDIKIIRKKLLVTP